MILFVRLLLADSCKIYIFALKENGARERHLKKIWETTRLSKDHILILIRD